MGASARAGAMPAIARRASALLVLAAVLLAAFPADAAEEAAAPPAPAGKVKRSEGSVSVDHAGQTQPLPVGSPVFVGDRIRTGSDAAVGVTLSDDTLLTAGPNSTLLINEFEFNSTTEEGSLLATLVKGTLSVVTGLIAKQAPEKVQFKTPNVVLGVRGTEFIIETRGEGQ
ncbi:MAG: FecR protein [Candidatus Accumulibacter appositus]|mgnify:CR=1 FL=1|uniref:FecR protein n=1 Tax=Candidatus Accumulibacter appositus TaxID=1454003 RepID=A0A011NTI5_9PROT|nr:FecR domain-containing protein [Accumulibacter sp.]EXI78661.1 MAG: FecR protein [Candidatus Accumulibacter appositus]HRF03323.1 FecR domain-containing protein [Accumulibacter sp.]